MNFKFNDFIVFSESKYSVALYQVINCDGDNYVVIDERGDFKFFDKKRAKDSFKVASDKDIKKILNYYLSQELNGDEWCANRYREQNLYRI